MSRLEALPLLLVLFLLQILDVMTTDRVPNLEVNPVTLYFFGHLGAAWWVPKACIFVVIAAGVAMVRRVPKRTLVMVTAGYAVVVGLNLANVAAIYLMT